MRLWTAVFALFLALGSPAFAGLTQSQLDGVGELPPANARLPLNLLFQDEAGRLLHLGEALGGTPTVVIFADYTCKTLCGPILAMTAAALSESGLRPGKDFHLVVIGIDPKDHASDAQKMKRDQIGGSASLANATRLLVGDSEAIAAATKAFGYRAVYDKENDQFAHPTTAFAVTKDGRLSRVLSALGLNPGDLHFALVDTGGGEVGTIADRLRLLCYHFDPQMGIYSLSIARLIDFGAGLTVLLLGGGIGGLLLWDARRRA